MLTESEKLIIHSGMALDTRKRVHQELCLASIRAQWEADRLYQLPDRWLEHDSYASSMTEQYESQILARNKIGDKLRIAMNAESIKNHWPTPSKDTLDIKGLSRDVRSCVRDAR